MSEPTDFQIAQAMKYHAAHGTDLIEFLGSVDGWRIIHAGEKAKIYEHRTLIEALVLDAKDRQSQCTKTYCAHPDRCPIDCTDESLHVTPPGA